MDESVPWFVIENKSTMSIEQMNEISVEAVGIKYDFRLKGCF